ncbi:hypothetical protein [Azospirillum sp. ST 5-10]|uniref:hypothetical protein n=1 Tax=unclassified Azospirillum TaxID=2630922 RepID=UPI003F4A08A0
MSDLMHDPFVQSSILPLVASLLAVGVLHALGARRGLAAAGIGLGFLAIFTLVVGVPALPPPSSMGKLFWCAAAGVALAAAVDAAAPDGRIAPPLTALWLAASLVWIGLPVLDSAAAVATLAVLLAVAAWVAFARPAGSAGPTAPAASLLALGLAVGGTALIGSSASVAQLGLALAAAAGGFLLWNWPVERHGWGMSGRVALGIAVLLAGVLAFFSEAPVAVLVLALPALLADRLRRILPVADTGFGHAAGAAAVTVAAVLPAAVAVAAAYALSGGEASPY